nr:hypothetical protein Iba_chr05cCG12500 [Ipomoea batatas]
MKKSILGSKPSASGPILHGVHAMNPYRSWPAYNGGDCIHEFISKQHFTRLDTPKSQVAVLSTYRHDNTL